MTSTAGMSTTRFSEKAKAWVILSRPPFHTVGVMPFALGSVMAAAVTGSFDWALWGWGTFAVVLILLATHWTGECFDHEEDRLSGDMGRSRFAGGTGMVQAGHVSRGQALKGAVAAVLLAGIVGVVLQFGYKTGPWTIPLGLFGIVGGFLYSTPPVRWVSTGTGEIWIAACYGFLTVAVGYYLPTGNIHPLIPFIGVPIGATIFNVILANEYPDYLSDQAAGKNNLMQRIGRDRGALVYAGASVIAWIGIVVSVIFGAPMSVLAYAILPFSISAFVSLRLLRGAWNNPRELEVLCGLGIAANLTTTFAYLLAFVWK